jgi:hypothetical protein
MIPACRLYAVSAARQGLLATLAVAALRASQRAKSGKRPSSYYTITAGSGNNRPSRKAGHKKDNIRFADIIPHVARSQQPLPFSRARRAAFSIRRAEQLIHSDHDIVLKSSANPVPFSACNKSLDPATGIVTEWLPVGL